MATTEFNDATRTADSTTAGTLKDEQHHRTTVRLLVGAGAAIGLAPLLPWVRYTGLIQTETQPGGAAVVIGLIFAALLLLTALRTSRSSCSTKLAVSAAAASVLSIATGVYVIVGCGAHSSAFEKAQPGPGVYVLLGGASAGIIGLIRCYRRKSQ